MLTSSTDRIVARNAPKGRLGSVITELVVAAVILGVIAAIAAPRLFGNSPY